MIEIERSDREVPRGKEPHGDQWPCIVCGRGVDTEKARWIWVHKGGSHAVTDTEGEALNAAGEEGADLGLQVVGPECLRKHPELRPYAKKR